MLALLTRMLETLAKSRRLLVCGEDDDDDGIVYDLNKSFRLVDAFFDNFRQYFIKTNDVDSRIDRYVYAEYNYNKTYILDSHTINI
jgi:hypothetical protein